jgi:hypothetical protein
MDSIGKNFDAPKEDSIKEREERFLYLIKFLKKIDIQNIVEDQNKKSEFIQNLSFDEFKDFLLRLNGVVRDIPTSKREFNAGSQAKYLINIKDEDGVVRFCPPPNAIKMSLLEEAFNALKRMDSAKRIKDGAVMMGSAINAIHPFPNGNGRTARNISMLLASSKDEFYVTDPNPEPIQPFIENYIAQNIHNLSSLNAKRMDGFNITFPDLPQREQTELHEACQNDTKNFLIACRIFAAEKGEDFEKSYVYVSSDSNKLNLVKFILKYRNNIKEIMNQYNDLKKEYVETLIDIFENPNKYLLKDMPELFNNLQPELQKVFAKNTLLDIYYESLEQNTVSRGEFSWDYLTKFIKGEVL